MTSTMRDDFRRIVPNRQSPIPCTFRMAPDMPFEDIYGNGGLLTTVGDLLKWNSNLASANCILPYRTHAEARLFE